MKKIKNNKKGAGCSVGLLQCFNSQSCPTDNLVQGSSCPGLTQTRNEGQQVSRRRVSAARRLQLAGQRGRALLQGSARTRSAGRDGAGDRPVRRALLRIPVCEQRDARLIDCSKPEMKRVRDSSTARWDSAKGEMSSYWLLSSTARFLCCSGML